jgi:dTDP-4-amino-4,6-dideoxygalactose transaminase
MRVFDEKEIGYVREVLNSGSLGWNRGGMTGRFERAFAEFVGSRHAITRSSAMTGLAQAVSCSRAGWDTEVICDPVVHFGGISALNENATPVFADIESDTLLMDPDSVRQKITEKTKALIVTNLWGLCARLDELKRICDEHDIFMIEDCAHNMCSYWKGKHACTWGHIGVFSFQQGKHLPTGDGGMMITDDDELDHKLYNEWAFGGESPAFFTLNFRMNEVTAAIGLAQLERVRGYVDTYNACLKHLNAAIEGCEWLRPRRVDEDAVQSGYNWCCFWQGDKHGLSHDRFKEVAREVGAPLGFGFIQKPASHYDVFQSATDHAHPARKQFKRHAPYPGKKYTEDDCPVAEDTIWRIVSSGAMRSTEADGKQAADKIHAAIEVMNKG